MCRNFRDTATGFRDKATGGRFGAVGDSLNILLAIGFIAISRGRPALVALERSGIPFKNRLCHRGYSEHGCKKFGNAVLNGAAAAIITMLCGFDWNKHPAKK